MFLAQLSIKLIYLSFSLSNQPSLDFIPCSLGLYRAQLYSLSFLELFQLFNQKLRLYLSVPLTTIFILHFFFSLFILSKFSLSQSNNPSNTNSLISRQSFRIFLISLNAILIIIMQLFEPKYSSNIASNKVHLISGIVVQNLIYYPRLHIPFL